MVYPGRPSWRIGGGAGMGFEEAGKFVQLLRPFLGSLGDELEGLGEEELLRMRELDELSHFI